MSLVRYCINLEDAVDGIVSAIEGIKPEGFLYETGWQRSKGFRIQPKTNGTFCEDIAIPYGEYVITGLKLSVTSMKENFDETNDRGMDSFTLLANNEKIFEDVYIKDIVMYKNFKVPFKITEGSDLSLKLCYTNQSNAPVDIWFDIDFLAEPKLTEVTVNHTDNLGNEIMPSEVREISEGRMRVFAEDVIGYYVIDSYFQDIEVVYGNPVVVDFQYVKGDDV